MHQTLRSRLCPLLAATLLLAYGVVAAQRTVPASPAASAPVPTQKQPAPQQQQQQQQQQFDVDANAMIGGGLDILQIVDEDKASELWEGATPAAKTRVTRPDFISQVAQSRAGLGAPQQRTWVAINRQLMVDRDPTVAGQYLSVEFDTRFANAASRIVREMTTFKLDPDGVWRFAGYILR